MNIDLRRARADEIDQLTELSMRSKRSNGYDDAFMTACREELTVTAARMAAGEYWLAEADEICGCVCLLTTAHSPIGEIHAFFIDPTWQRRGIGRMLWQKIVARAQAKELSILCLDADPKAVSFYQAMGCQIVSYVPSGSIKGRLLPRMEIRLR